MASDKTPSDIERDNYNLEIMGLNFSQSQKFIPQEDHPNSEKNKKNEREKLSALMLLLQDEEYARLYYDLDKTITDLDQLTSGLINDFEKQIILQKHALENAEAKANRLYDGRMVFKDKNGNVVTENDETITDQTLLESIIWKDDAPTYEEYQDLKDGLSASEVELQALREYQTDVLGDIRNRLENENDPLTKDELEKLQHDVYDNAPDIIKAKLDANGSIADMEIKEPSNTAMLKL